MTQPSANLSAEADAVRAEEREAIRRLARGIAAEAARATGNRDAADVSANFIDFILGQAYAARDSELDAMRRGAGEQPAG